MTHKLLANRDKGLFFIISAPAGAGKTTLVNMLTKDFECVARSVSYTTRSPRIGEVDGVDYFFISEEDFKKKIEKGDFLEYANVFGSYYGTSKEFVEKKINENKHVVLVIDTQGAAKLREKGIGIHIFISPPDPETLKSRLINRNLDSESVIKKRLFFSQGEMEQAQFYDYEIVNDKLDIAYQILKSIVIAEEHRLNKKR
jgi:guanylate kinase